MLSFKNYFLIKESPTIIKYGTRNIPMDESVITFIVSEYELDRQRYFDSYIFQTTNSKLPKLFHVDGSFKVKDVSSMTSQTQIMYHDNMGHIFNLDMGLDAEEEYVRGRLWIDPENKTRVLVSMWTFREDFDRKFKPFFEKLIKKIIPSANEFAYEHYLSNSKGINFAPDNTTVVNQTQIDKWKKEKAELLAKYHVVTGVERNVVKLKIQDLNKKLGIKEDPFEFMKVTKPAKGPSWMGRDGD
jgi:hypothetical protein